jgi:hypothetical protein
MLQKAISLGTSPECNGDSASTIQQSLRRQSDRCGRGLAHVIDCGELGSFKSDVVGSPGIAGRA